MQVGRHFGKRKPQWNFFYKYSIHYFNSINNVLVKLSLTFTVLQTLILSPVIYWTIENYTLFEKTIPVQTQLIENIQAERKWIVLLFSFFILISFVLNFVLLKITIGKYDEINEKFSSIDGSPDLHRVSS